ncbi:stage III sporulation protein AA [Paenibacillus xanthanilyticus]|uniref:Stage III sporulation protein AA n=1 Tax=Paenibacillus xanthanilyticus TaxID=1783531 RepID=A0ABV8KD29_9BACL
MLTRVVHLLPAELAAVLERMPDQVKDKLEEIRIRESRALEIGFAGGFRYIAPDGTPMSQPHGAFRPSGDLCRKLLERVTNHSLYAMEEELRRGYITVAGGHRIGIAGRTVLDGGHVRGIRDVGAFNIRIAREVIGASAKLLPKLLDFNRRSVIPALIVAPPQQGKTTLVRDIARAVSAGQWGHAAAAGWEGRKVGIVDERSEIAACVRGVPTFDIGPRTDVMDACPKAEGMMMMLRSMSPDVLIVDEIGRPEDAEAILDASHAGIAVIATAHAKDLEEARGRPAIERLLAAGAFDVCVELRKNADGLSGRVVRALPAARSPSALERTPAGGNGHG